LASSRRAPVFEALREGFIKGCGWRRPRPPRRAAREPSRLCARGFGPLEGTDQDWGWGEMGRRRVGETGGGVGWDEFRVFGIIIY